MELPTKREWKGPRWPMGRFVVMAVFVVLGFMVIWRLGFPAVRGGGEERPNLTEVGGEVRRGEVGRQEDFRTQWRHLSKGTKLGMAAESAGDDRGEGLKAACHLPEDPGQAVAKLWSWLDRYPEQRIPELYLLDPEDMLAVVSEVAADSTIEEALAKARTKAKGRFADEMSMALYEHMQENGQAVPSSLMELLPRLPGVDPTMLERYTMTPKPGTVLSAEEWSGPVVMERPVRISHHDTMVWAGALSRAFIQPQFPGNALSLPDSRP